MNITFESELMANHKHAVVMAPDLAFDVLQTKDSSSLFFSIGTDKVFYLTREVTQTSTGWSKIDLSSALSSQHGNAPVAAKTFSIAQNAQTLAIDLALVITVGGADFLYLSLGNVNTDATWSKGVTWTAIPFDAGTAPSPLTIADVFIMNLPSVGSESAVENTFVDILRTPSSSLQLIDRYYIKLSGFPRWNSHRLAADLAAGSISSCLGKRTNDPISGIYTFGRIGSEQELMFTPQYNYFRPTVPPSPARLTLPVGASAIASAINDSGLSNLFVSGIQGLFLFTPDNQHDQATPILIVSNPITAGASTLAAATAGNQTAVWGINPQGTLFYVTCPAGKEADPTAWSTPMPLLPKAERFAFFLNLKAGNNVLFAHVDGQNLVQLTQDPIITNWQQRNILLPSTSPNDVAVYNTFTTHIQVTDEHGVAAPNAALALTATSPVSVYLNDVYYLLSPTVAVKTTADASGVLTVVQETQSLSAVCFRVVLTDKPEVVANINPMSKALSTLSSIQNGTDLSNVQVTNADGTRQPLVPSKVSTKDREAVAKSLVQFTQIASKLPQDGSLQSNSPRPRMAMMAAATSSGGWGITFTDEGLTYHEGADAPQVLGLRQPLSESMLAEGFLATPESLLSISDIEVAAGDFFLWLKQAFAQVESFVVQEAEGFYHFLAKIGDEVYDVLLDCVDAVVHAVEFVFNKIKVFFEDLIKWLGFIFEWSDILRTHSVLKNIFNQYLNKCVNNMGNVRAQLQHTFADAVKYIDAWAGIPDNIPSGLSGTSLNSATGATQPIPGQNSPQSNWGLHHLKSNAANGSTTALPNAGVLGDVVGLLTPLVEALEREKEVFQATAVSFKSNIVDKIHDISIEQLMKAMVAIIGDALLESIENVLLAAIDVLIALVEGCMDVLNATIDIPVISWIYKEITGSDMSLLDVICLIAAIPTTIGYKLIANVAPFPDNAATAALIKAPNFDSIRKIYRPTHLLSAEVASIAAPAAISSPSVNDILVLTGGIASTVGAIALCVFPPLKQKFPGARVFSVLTGLSYLLYVAPDIMGQIPDLQNKKWWAISNEIITDLIVVKTSLVDLGVGLTAEGSAASGAWNPVTPWLDFAGNILWQVPTTGALFDTENQNVPGILNFWGGTCFDCNGILSPALADDSEPITWGILVALAAFFNLAYGSMSCAASALTFKNDQTGD